MVLSVRGYGIEVTPEVGRRVERRLSFALARFGRRVTAVSIGLMDLKGPRGSVDKKCLIEARLAPRGSVKVEDVDSEVLAAFDAAVARLERIVARVLVRGRPGGLAGMRGRGRG